MKVLDPGHKFELRSLDNFLPTTIQFVKRIGQNYPGNTGQPISGTNCQEPLRAIASRCDYLNKQFWCIETTISKWLLYFAIWLFEIRAARIKKRWPPGLFSSVHGIQCSFCGHINCKCNGAS